MNSFLKSVTVVLVFWIAAGCQSTSPAGSGTSATGAGVPSDPVHAYFESMRKNLSGDKAKIYQEVMSPTPQEAAVFWPIFQNYEKESFALGERRLELVKGFAQAYNAGKLDAVKSAEISSGWLKIREDSVALLKKYHAIFSKELSPLQAAQFLQVEHRVATVIDLLVAAELPLLRLNPVEADPAHAKG